MAIYTGPNQVEDGLVLNLDVNSILSYPKIGTVWYDLSSNPLNPAILNGVSYTSTGIRKFTLDGVDDYFDFGYIASDSKVSLIENFSIVQVFKPTNYQPSTYFGLTNLLLYKGNLSTVNYLTELIDDTTVSFLKRSTGESLQGHTFTVPSMLNNINVLTFVISGNTTVDCYMNDAYINTLTINGLAMEAQSSEVLRITNPTVDTMAFIGDYYSCKIYNKPLIETEVIQNFNAIKSRYNL